MKFIREKTKLNEMVTFLGKNIAKYEYMEGRYYSKFTYSLLKNLYPENRRYVMSRLALIRIIIINLTALVLGIVSLIISQYV